MDMERTVVIVLLLCVLGFSVAEIINDNADSGRAEYVQQHQPEGPGGSLSDFLGDLTNGKGWDSEDFFENAQNEFREEGRGSCIYSSFN